MNRWWPGPFSSPLLLPAVLSLLCAALPPGKASALEKAEAEYARLVRSGVEAFQAGRFGEAADRFKKALEKKSEAGTWFNLGAAYFLGERPAEAERAFRNAVKLRRGFYPEAQRYLGRILYEKGDWSGCVEALAACLSPGGDRGCWKIMAAAYEQLEDEGNTQRALEMAVLADPKDAQLRTSLAQALYRSGRFEAAEVEFRSALRLKPADTTLRRYLGYTLVALHKETEAIDALETALRLGADDRFLLAALADLYSAKNMHREAAAAFQRVLGGGRVGPEERYRLGNLHLRAGDPAKARKSFQQALELAPGHRGALLALADLALAEGKTGEAEKRFEEVLKKNPGDSEGWKGLGDVAFGRGDYPASVEKYEKALAIDSSSPGLWRKMGHAEFSRERWGAAAKAYRRALEIDPGDREAEAYLSASESLVRRTR
jgi:tetratricopeptide (TPR) repeat protein